MNVAFFGTGERRLFGIYEAPPVERAKPRGIVLCPAWGSEYLMSHRSMRQLATMLAASGMHVLRFDYFGTGDSAGDVADVSMRGCESDINSAVEELIEVSRAEHVSLVGLRLGADLAARVCASGIRRFRDLVLWDPIVGGSEYLAELVPVRNMADRAASEINAGGFATSDTFQAELTSANLMSLFERLPARTLIATSEDRPALTAVRQRIAAGPSSIRLVHIDGRNAWREQGNLGLAVVPVELLSAIVAWLIE